MDINQVNALINNNSLPGNCQNAELKETHISWIILTDDYTFKIKRPVHYSFVDFSTLEKRKFYCHEELRLNKRLAPEMYLKVLPLSAGMFSKTNNKKEKKIIDYAVQMKRMDNRKEMDRLLQSGNVTSKQINKLADTIAEFHDRVDIIKKPFDTKVFQKMYADITSLSSYLKKTAGREWTETINECIDKSGAFLRENEDLLNDRVNEGYIKDCHGDLNSRNIFLYDDPVIFDCIEFNDELRQIDILNDIAFLCVDLDFFDNQNLSELFVSRYCNYMSVSRRQDTRKLLKYYKSYRANIRAKVTLITARKMKADDNATEIHDAKKYISLMKNYAESI